MTATIDRRRCRTVSFAVPGVPQPAGSKRGYVNRKTGAVIITDANRKAKGWQAQVADASAAAIDGELLTGPLSLTVTFWLPRPAGHYGTGRNAGTVKQTAPFWHHVRPDLTKLVRGLEDALTGLVWRDDAQVVHQQLTKRYGPTALTTVEVVELGQSEAV